MGWSIFTFSTGIMMDIKKKAGINNLWKHEEDKRLNEYSIKFLNLNILKIAWNTSKFHYNKFEVTFDFSNNFKNEQY